MYCGLNITAQQQASFFQIQKELADLDFKFTQLKKDSLYPIYYKDSAQFKKDTILFRKKYLDLYWVKYKIHHQNKTITFNKLTNLNFPDIIFLNSQNINVALSDFSNQSIILNFNYYYCLSCLAQIDSILLITKTNKTKLIVILSTTIEDVIFLQEKYGERILVGYMSQEFENYYTFNCGTPSTFLIDKNRTISKFLFDKSTKGDSELLKQILIFNE